jgi:hypothetical protein
MSLSVSFEMKAFVHDQLRSHMNFNNDDEFSASSSFRFFVPLRTVVLLINIYQSCVFSDDSNTYQQTSERIFLIVHRSKIELMTVCVLCTCSLRKQGVTN